MDSGNQEAHILLVVGTLIEAAADRDESVRDAVIMSLRQLAKKYPSKVLRHAIEYRTNTPKMSAAHLGALLRTMELVCQERVADIDGDEVLQLIQFSVTEMTRTPEYLPSLQMPAAGILAALGKAHCNEVMEGLLMHFQPGIVPHYAILHTMGSLASANAFGIIPFVKATLGTMLPMMGMLRSNAMRQVFAYALGKFSDAVSEYMANIDHAPDPTVKAEAFSTELSIAYDMLACVWINSKEHKLVETVLQALGPMVDVLPPDKVGEQVPRLVSTLLGLYRRNVDPHPVTQCLAAVLLVAVTHCKAGLESQLDHLLGVVFDLVCASPDYAQPLTVKNHYEVLRCFDRIACHFTDRVVELLIQQLKNNNERERIKALFVITHLVNSSENLIKSRIVDLITGLRNMLEEHNVKVKKVLLKTIIAFAYRGYPEGSEGQEFVEFIVKHCCDVTASGSKEEDEGEELRVTCSNTLYLLATTVPQVETSLWPLLLHFLLAPQYTAASPVLARCLAHLATKQRDDMHYNTLAKDDAPSANKVFGRCLALLGSPLQAGRGVFILNFLKNYASSVNRHLKPLWEQKVPELILHLEDYKDAWQEAVWEDLVLDLLSATLNEVDEEKWTLGLGLTLMEQLGSYGGGYPAERAMLYKCVAVTACHTTDKHYAQQQLDVLLGGARHYHSYEARAVARAIAICARAHLQEVLACLRKLCQEELGRKSSRLLPFIKDSKHEEEQERIRRTLLLCYGEVALEAPGVELLPQLEHGPAHWVLQQLTTVKDVEGKELALRALGSVVEAFHPNRNSLHVVLHGRSQVLRLVLNQLSLGPRTYPSALQVLTALVKLPPPLTAEERVDVLKTCFTHVFLAVKAADMRTQGAHPDDVVTAGLQWSEDAALILYALGMLVQELLLVAVTPATLDEVFTLLEPWLAAGGPHERAAATATFCTVLQCYLDNLKFGYEAPTRFSQAGRMLGIIVPRCTDPSLAVRHKAVDCVRLVLCLAARYEGQHADHDNDLTGALCSVQDQVMTSDPSKLFLATGELAQIMCGKLPHWQLMHFADSLMEAVLDSAPSSASGASVVLNTLLKHKGGEMYHHVSDLLGSMLRKLGDVQCEQARTGCLRAVLSLAAHHPKAVVAALLHQPIPYQAPVVDCWMMLAQDPELSSDIIEQFLRLVSSSQLYEELPEKDKFKMAMLQPLAAISAMKEMFHVATMQELAIARFPELFCLLYLATGCYVGTSPPVHTPQHNNKDRLSFVPNRNAYKLSPARVAQEAFQSFLLCARCEGVAEALLQCSSIDTKESLSCFVDMVPHLVRAVSTAVPHMLPKLITQLNQYSTTSYDPQRIAVAAFYSELIRLQVNGQIVLLECVISSQLNCLRDPSPLVRQLCLTGLSSVSQLDAEQRGHYAESVLAALTQGLDDHDAGGSIALAAVTGFSLMLPVIEDHHVQAIQGTVAIRIKHFFEREDGSMRAAAIRMFGDLASCSTSGCKGAFREQVTGNLVCFLLHLSDPDEHVIKACKHTLRQVGPLLRAPRTNAMLQDHLVDAATLHFSHFMTDLAKLLAEELPDLVPQMIMNALTYIKSSWPTIRGNAGILIGGLHGALPAEAAMLVQLDAVCLRLSMLLRDDEAAVRVKAAKAIGCMFPG